MEGVRDVRREPRLIVFTLVVEADEIDRPFVAEEHSRSASPEAVVQRGSQTKHQLVTALMTVNFNTIASDSGPADTLRT